MQPTYIMDEVELIYNHRGALGPCKKCTAHHQIGGEMHFEMPYRHRHFICFYSSRTETISWLTYTHLQFECDSLCVCASVDGVWEISMIFFPTIDEHIQWDWVRLPNQQKNMQMVVKCVCVYGAWPKVGHSMPPKIRTFLVVMVIAGRNVAIHQTQALFSVWHSCPKQNQWFHVTQLSNLKLTGHLPACVAPGSCLSGSTSWQKSLQRAMGLWVDAKETVKADFVHASSPQDQFWDSTWSTLKVL